MKTALLLLVIVIVLGGLFLFYQFRKFSSVTTGTQIAKYNTPQKALLVIDLQKDLTDTNGKAIINLKQTDEAIKNVNRIIDTAEKNDLIVVYIRHEAEPNFLVNFITRGTLAEGSTGSELDERIKVVSENFFVKNVMDAFSNKSFENFLLNKNVDHVIITGVNAEHCVDRTLKAALNRGYAATVISDAIATKNDDRLAKKIEEFKELGASIASTEKMLAQDL